jgi:hypothetical protein
MKKAPETVCRINKSSLDSLSDERMYYYMDFRDDDSKEVVYVLVDNRKGKKTLTEYDSIKKLEEALKK